MLRTITREVDPLRRETEPGADPEEGHWGELRRYVNEVKSQTPGWSKTLEPQLNLWGDPIEVPSGWGPDFLSPVYQSIKKHDPSGDEIVRLQAMGKVSVGRAGRVILGKDPESHPIDQPASPLDAGIELTDKEYSQLVKLAGNEFKDPSTGLGMHDTLNKLVTGDERYKKASDDMKGVIITNLVMAFRQAAVGQLLKRQSGFGRCVQGKSE